MTNELLATLLGGTLTLAGGFFGWIGQQAYETMRRRRQARSDLIAAIRLVRYELTTNITFLDGLMHPSAPRIRFAELLDTNYRSVQSVFVLGLPDALRTDLANLYSVDIPYTARIVRHYEEICFDPSTPSPTRTSVTRDTFLELQRAVAEMKTANQKLLDYLQSGLKAAP